MTWYIYGKAAGKTALIDKVDGPRYWAEEIAFIELYCWSDEGLTVSISREERPTDIDYDELLERISK